MAFLFSKEKNKVEGNQHYVEQLLQFANALNFQNRRGGVGCTRCSILFFKQYIENMNFNNITTIEGEG